MLNIYECTLFLNMGEFMWVLLLLSLWNDDLWEVSWCYYHFSEHGTRFPCISNTFLSFFFLFKIQAVDVFAGSLSSPEERFYVAGEIARILGVPYQGETVQPTEKPTIQARFYSFTPFVSDYRSFWLSSRHSLYLGA